MSTTNGFLVQRSSPPTTHQPIRHPPAGHVYDYLGAAAFAFTPLPPFCLYTIAFGCAARFFRDGDVGDATTLPPSMTSPCRDRELCCALALLEVQRGWTGRHIRGAHIPRHQRQPRTFSRARAQRRGRGWAGRAQHPWATMARGLAVQWQWFGAKVRGQGSAVASGTRAVAGHYHRRRDASRSGSTRDQERCTPRSLCRARWQS